MEKIIKQLNYLLNKRKNEREMKKYIELAKIMIEQNENHIPRID